MELPGMNKNLLRTTMRTSGAVYTSSFLNACAQTRRTNTTGRNDAVSAERRVGTTIY